MLRNVNTSEDEVMERWSMLLTNQAQASKDFLDLVESELDIRGCPYDISQTTIAQGLNYKRNFVKVQLNNAYSCYIGTEIIGKDIQFNWLLREKMSPFYKIPVVGPLFKRIILETSFIDRNRLIAFASFTKDCTLNVVESLMDKHDIDKEKLNKVSSGKLGPL